MPLVLQVLVGWVALPAWLSQPPPMNEYGSPARLYSPPAIELSLPDTLL